MVRDYRIAMQDYPYEALLHSPGGSSLWMAGSRRLPSLAQERADAISTPRSPSGAYTAATKYHSFHMIASHNPYQFRTYGIGGDPGVYVEETGDAAEPPFPYFGTWGCGSFWPHPPAVDFGIVQQARSMVMKQVRNGDWDLSTAVGEARKAGQDLGRSIRKADDVFKALAKNNHKWLMSLLPGSVGKATAGLILSYQYALMPLVNDAYQAAKTMSDGLTSNEPIGRIFVDLPDPSHQPPSVYSHLVGEVKGGFKRGFKTEVRIKLASSGLYSLDQYGITNPLSFAWELTTLSFVVDWFLHVGAFLDALIPPQGVSFDGGYETSYVDNKWHAEWHPKGAVPMTRSRLTCRTKSMTRFPLYVFAIPRPYLDLDLNVTQQVSAIALLKSRYGA